MMQGFKAKYFARGVKFGMGRNTGKVSDLFFTDDTTIDG